MVPNKNNAGIPEGSTDSVKLDQRVCEGYKFPDGTSQEESKTVAHNRQEVHTFDGKPFTCLIGVKFCALCSGKSGSLAY